MLRIAAAALLALSVQISPSPAGPNTQLVASVEHRLARYGLSADVSQYTTSTVARLHFALNERQGYFKKRRNLQWILRNARYK